METIPNTGKYRITDLKTQTVSFTDDILDAVEIADYLKRLGHNVRMLNTETGADFFWQANP